MAETDVILTPDQRVRVLISSTQRSWPRITGGVCSFGYLRQGWRRLPGYWVPATQVPDGLAVFPLDGVFEQVSQVPAGGDAGDVGDPAAGPNRDDEPLVVEGEHLQRPAVQLRVQVAGHRLALFQRHLRQRGQHVPGARIHHRGEVAGDVDLWVV